MTNPKHTPGPHRASCATCNEMIIQLMRAEAKCDDLLAACELARDMIGQAMRCGNFGEDTDERLATIDAAISKAKGET